MPGTLSLFFPLRKPGYTIKVKILLRFSRLLMLPLIVCVPAWTGNARAGDLKFSLRIDNFSTSRDPAHEAAMALWNDPMNRLIRDANAELGRILVGQPGGMAAPVISIGFQAGVQPAVIAGIIDNSIFFSRQRIAEINWKHPPSDEEFQREFIEEFSRRLEAAVGQTP